MDNAIIENGLAALEARPHLALSLANCRLAAAEAKARAESLYIESIGGEKALGSNAESRERALLVALTGGHESEAVRAAMSAYHGADAEVVNAAAELAEAEGDIALYLADRAERELALRERELVARLGGRVWLQTEEAGA